MDELVQAVLEDVRPAENAYFRALEAGAFARDDFVETQIQFYFAVVFFSRPMAAVAAKIPGQRERLGVLRNVWEEHGEGDPARFHGTTFLTFLERLAGVSLADVEERMLWPEVRAFNTALVGAAVVDEYRVSVACLGMIERMFADLSRALGRAVVAHGWLPAAQMIHYDLHETLDHRHADDFFAVVRADAQDPAHRYFIEQGLRLGATVFDRLYDDLYRHRARRWRRTTRGPHVRT